MTSWCPYIYGLYKTDRSAISLCVAAKARTKKLIIVSDFRSHVGSATGTDHRLVMK